MIKELSKKYKEYVISLRRELHQCPGLNWHEDEASAIIKRELDKMGLEYKSCAKTGVVVDIKGNKEGKCVLLRADMDGLPVTENTDLEFKSKNVGVMHACGHDGHMSQLLGAIKILNESRDQINGTVRCIFQPAEEVGQGADKMIEEGVLENVDFAFAIHVWADIPVGKVSIEKGPRMASADNFNIKIIGKGGHGSLPYQCIDPIIPAASYVLNLQSIVSREINPNDAVIITVGRIEGGTTANVIPDYAEVEGTVRCYNPELRKQIPQMMERILKGTADCYRSTYEMEYNYYPAPVINDEKYSEIAANSLVKMYGEDALFTMEKKTTAEDFSAFCNRVPGVLAFVGISNPEKNCIYPQHHSKYDIDEDGLEIGSALYAQVAIDFLNS